MAALYDRPRELVKLFQVSKGYEKKLNPFQEGMRHLAGISDIVVGEIRN